MWKHSLGAFVSGVSLSILLATILPVYSRLTQRLGEGLSELSTPVLIRHIEVGSDGTILVNWQPDTLVRVYDFRPAHQFGLQRSYSCGSKMMFIPPNGGVLSVRASLSRMHYLWGDIQGSGCSLSWLPAKSQVAPPGSYALDSGCSTLGCWRISPAQTVEDSVIASTTHYRADESARVSVWETAVTSNGKRYSGEAVCPGQRPSIAVAEIASLTSEACAAIGGSVQETSSGEANLLAEFGISSLYHVNYVLWRAGLAEMHEGIAPEEATRKGYPKLAMKELSQRSEQLRRLGFCWCFQPGSVD